MLVNSVIIVLREVIEAALMISVLFALSRRQPVVSRWLLPAIGAGLVGAFAYAHFLEPVSDLFGGTGQELLNAAAGRAARPAGERGSGRGAPGAVMSPPIREERRRYLSESCVGRAAVPRQQSRTDRGS